MEYLRENGRDHGIIMAELDEWLKENSDGRPVLVSDNNGFDAAFVAYYYALAEMKNPFGFSSRRIGDLYSGFKQDARKASDWKRLRTAKHTHNALDDAKGNAGAVLKMAEMGLRIPGLTQTL